jgi:hypothetical protein
MDVSRHLVYLEVDIVIAAAYPQVSALIVDEALTRWAARLASDADCSLPSPAYPEGPPS